MCGVWLGMAGCMDRGRGEQNILGVHVDRRYGRESRGYGMRGGRLGVLIHGGGWGMVGDGGREGLSTAYGREHNEGLWLGGREL